MENQEVAKHQVVALLMGESGAGKSWVADRLVTAMDWDGKLSIVSILRDMVTDPSVFGIPARYYSDNSKDQPMDFPVQVQDGHLRRIVSWLAERIPPQLRSSMKNDIRKVSITSFAKPTLRTPREVLQYIGFSVVNKISLFTTGSLDLLPTLAYNAVVGIPGRFVFDDLRMKHQAELARLKFQLPYLIRVEGFEKKKTVMQNKSQYASEEGEWEDIEPFYVIKNSKDLGAADIAIKSAVDAIMVDVQMKIKQRKITPLLPTAKIATKEYIESKGPLGQGLENLPPNTMKVGKAMFTKARLDEQGKMTEFSTPDHKIQLKYSKAKN